jgi:predicted nucleic acid-binding protein
VKTGYLDSSVVLRWLLRDHNALHDFGSWKHAASSFLLEVECVRTLDRLINENRISAPVKTLDAIHIATAQLWQAERADTILLLSQDQKMNLVAKSIGLKTLESK